MDNKIGNCGLDSFGGKTMHLRKAIILGLILTCLPISVWAKSKVFVENYSYNAGEADSKLTCRTVSLLEVKRLLLEKLGTYLETRTEVKDFQVTKDEIVALTAGIVKTEILDEKWNGETYTLTARIQANPDDVAKAIDNIRKQPGGVGKVQKLEEINAETLDQLRDMQTQMEQLQSNLLKVNQDMDANAGLLNTWGMYEKGVKLRQSGMAEEAIEVLSTVIENNPTHLAFSERGYAYMELKMYDKAIKDFTNALQIEPNMRGPLWGRGIAYMKTGNKQKGKKDIKQAADLGNPRAKKWIDSRKKRSLF
jgi:tetratricopeptide (TPR) repeat protein